MRTSLVSLAVFASLGSLPVAHATDMEGPMSPCAGVEIFRFEQSGYASIQQSRFEDPVTQNRSNDEYEIGEYTFTESALSFRSTTTDKNTYARGTQTTLITENSINFVNNNFSTARYSTGAHLVTQSSAVVMFIVDDNLESDSGFSLSPSRPHSVWLDMRVRLNATGELEYAGDIVPGSMVRLIGPDGMIYSDSALLSSPQSERSVYEDFGMELTPGMYILAVDAMTEIKGVDHLGTSATGFANVKLTFSETASEGDVGATILSQYRESSTSYGSAADDGPCKASLQETSGSDAWSYQDSDIRSLNTYGAFYNFARGNRIGQTRNSDGLLSVEFRLEEDANMDVMLRGTYEVHKSFGDLSQAGYTVRVEDLSSGEVAYLQTNTYRSSGSGGIDISETTMLPAGDYLLTIETFATSRKGRFGGRGRLDAAMSLSPSVSFRN